MEIRKMNTKINIPEFTRLFAGEIIIFHNDNLLVISDTGSTVEELINTPERKTLIEANSEKMYKEK